MSYAASAAGGRVPRLRAVAEVGPDSTLLAYDEVVGRTFDELGPGTVTDTDLDAVYRAVRTLHDERIVHRALSPEQLIKADDGAVWLAGVQHGTIAASDVQERIDLAELLVTGALLTDVPRAVAAGVRTFGVDRLARALPALQTIALSPDTRRRVRGRKDVLVALRDELIALRPSAAETEQLELRRVKPRTLFTIVAGSIAAYVLLSQLAQVDLVGLFREAQWNWALLALVLSFLTFIGASLSLSGFVPESLTHVRTFAAQLAAGFATLVSPPTVGAVAVNVRYLQKSGLHPALAAASVGVSQVFALFVHITLLFVTAIAAGQRADIHFAPPRAAVIGVIAILVVLGLSLLFGPVRKTVVDRARPIVVEVGPRLLTVAQRPWKIAEGVGGILLLNAAFALCMIASCEAFGATDMNYAAVALVYLAGSTLGQAAPTPGGLGAVEAAYIAGLTLAGIDSGVAVSATLLFRLLTFWLPTVPGYWCFNWLQRVGAL
jgi:glycosyltransferase 2 family protein